MALPTYPHPALDKEPAAPGQEAFVSTGGFRGRTVLESVNELRAGGITRIELSGGMYTPGLLRELRRLSGELELRLHNYFPPPRVPFVLNVASVDDEVAARSLGHIRQSVRWVAELGGNVFSFHAGFRFEPRVGELGQGAKWKRLAPRAECLERFAGRVEALAVEAEVLGVSLLIENNVLSAANLSLFGEDPFLMTEPDECVEVMRITPDNVGLLLDVGHAKVSARSLDFGAAEMLERCREWTRAYHFSENSGLEDDNAAVREDSWFWPHVGCDAEYYSLEVYNASVGGLRTQAMLVGSMLDRICGRSALTSG